MINYLFSYKYISENGLKNLKNYSYNGVDHSIIAPILQKFWIRAVYWLPIWIA